MGVPVHFFYCGSGHPYSMGSSCKWRHDSPNIYSFLSLYIFSTAVWANQPLDFVLKTEYNTAVDLFNLTKSKTRLKILRLFLSDPDKPLYLRQLSKILKLSAGNIRRELLVMMKLQLFETVKKGQLVYYKINQDSPVFQMVVKILRDNNHQNIEKIARQWVSQKKSVPVSRENYCASRDIFSARLESVYSKLEPAIRDNAYLLTAVIGEIGNNSFDHNLGSWPDIPGIFFALDLKSRMILLADRGQGILKTISRVFPQVRDDRQALKIAFTKTVSGRFPEKRGNGLKFVAKVVKEKKWNLQFQSGDAQIILSNGRMDFKNLPYVKGCLAVIKY